jgi:ubiquitin-protein ligase
MDPFHINQTIEEFFKYMINFKELDSMFEKFPDNNKNNKIVEKFPKELLLSSVQIKYLIVNEIKKVNRNKTYEHYIVPDETNPYNLIIRLKFSKDTEIGKLFEKMKHEYMEMKLLLNPKGYPYVPPELQYIKPRIKLPLLSSLLNLEILHINNWNPTITLDYLIPKLATEIETKGLQYIVTEENNDNELMEYSLVKFAIKIKEFSEQIIKIDVPKLISTSTETYSKYWKSGTGYGTNDLKEWDIKSYIQEQELINDELTVIISTINRQINDSNYHMILDVLINYITKQISGLSLLELEKNKKLYATMFKTLANIIMKPINQSIVNMISMSCKTIFEELDLVLKNSQHLLNDEDILEIYCTSDYYVSKYIEPIKEISISSDIKEQYCNVMKKLQFGSYQLPYYHRFISSKGGKPEQKALVRILSEISSFKTGLPLNWESTIWVRVPKDNFNLLSFMISGPKDTPYENGLFEFHAYLPSDYPNTVPKVLLHTTGNNTVRFNPNLYNCGKVCLSLLGTWSGQAGESWNPKTSTFLQILVSIQSLILVEQPFFNEPSYEREMHTPQGKMKSDAYNEEKQPHTINLGMIEMIKNPPQGFEDVVRNHFKMKKDEIINRTLIWEQNSKKGQAISIKRKELIELLSTLN